MGSALKIERGFLDKSGFARILSFFLCLCKASRISKQPSKLSEKKSAQI
jgi:hypothetical protein